MSKVFKVGDHVKWNSEAGSVSGVIPRKLTSNTRFKGYLHHASKDEPRNMINSDKWDHAAIHKGSVFSSSAKHIHKAFHFGLVSRTT